MLRDFPIPFLRVGASFAGALALAVLTTPLAACGVKGPLKLPQSQTPAAETPSSDATAEPPQQAPPRP
jgi:predicted small lipoprotein YifL